MDIPGSIDQQTRCRHYNTELDVIAIKMYCCGIYYPCYRCHEELSSHDIQVWPIQMYDQTVVVCGSCDLKMSIINYLSCDYQCPACGHLFNPGCRKHHQLYFERN